MRSCLHCDEPLWAHPGHEHESPRARRGQRLAELEARLNVATFSDPLADGGLREVAAVVRGVLRELRDL